MREKLKNTSLLDLVKIKYQEIHMKLESIGEQRWGENVTQSESYMLEVVGKESMTIAETARKINISRQAAHKCVQGLIGKGYISIAVMEGNQRDKLILLTEKGMQYYSEVLAIKEELEEEIEEIIGKANIDILRECLNSKWF